MQYIYEVIGSEDVGGIEEVYQLLKEAGKSMLKNYGLDHWAGEYPIRQIVRDCESKQVVVVRNEKSKPALATFQLNIEHSSSTGDSSATAEISKFATAPNLTGRGIGGAVLQQIEAYCRRTGVQRLRLDVYTKSTGAIRFYERHGFRKVRMRPTRRFEVWEMTRDLSPLEVIESPIDEVGGE